MSIRPLQDRVVVRRKEQETTTASGIVLTSSAQEKPNEGEVVAAGKGRVKSDGEIQPMDVKVGDIVLFGQYAGSAVKIDGEELLIMSEDDILGVLS